jgi:inorganic pyrophosphatase
LLQLAPVSAVVQFPEVLEVRIETSRGGLIKRRDDGSVDYISPLPAPFNYGSVPNTLAADGDREDCIVLGERLSTGESVRVRVLGRVRFWDAGVVDDKWICGDSLSRTELRTIIGFFRFYAVAKGALNLLRGARARTRYGGIELAPHEADGPTPRKAAGA